MSDSNNDFVTVTSKAKPSQDHGTKHQIRMEITLAAESGKVNIAGIVSEVVKRANSGLIPVRFFDVNNLPFTTATVPSGGEFVTRLAVEKVERGRTRKVVLGFYMQSRRNMNDIKSAIGIQWLQHNKIYLRPQRMSFTHGTDLFLIGYLAKEHPLTANMHDLENNIRTKWLPQTVHTLDDEMMADEDEPDKPSPEFVALLKVLTERGLIKDQQLQFPTTIERSIIKVNAPDKPGFETQILSVFVPRKYSEAATLLNDFSINERGDISIIPFSLSKNVPAQFYQQMAQHAEYMHDHRNIPIFSVPSTRYRTDKIPFPPQNEGPQVSLEQLLSRNPSVYRVYTRLEEEKIQVSVIGVDNYYKICKWLDELLPTFEYSPYRLSSRSGPNPPQSTLYPAQPPKQHFTNKYNDRFAMPENPSSPTRFDPSTTPQPRQARRGTKYNAWNHGPPIEVSYDPKEPMTQEEVYPILPLPPQPVLQHRDPRHSEENGGYGNQASTPSGPDNAPPDSQSTTRNYAPRSAPGRGRGYGQNRPAYSFLGGATKPSHVPTNDANPSNTSPDTSLHDIIAQAVAASTAKLTAELHDNREKFSQIETRFNELQQLIHDNAKQIASATSEATIAALTGASSPFITKADNLKNQEQQLNVQTTISAMQTSIDKLITTFLTHTNTGPLTPPRAHKLPRRDTPPSNAPPADPTTKTSFDMEEDGEVGEH